MKKSKQLRPADVPLGDSVPRPGDFAIGSTESRAAARLLVELTPRAPDVFIFFVYGDNERGDNIRAKCLTADGEFTREPGESEEGFQERVHRSLPKRRTPHMVVFSPREKSA